MELDKLPQVACGLVAYSLHVPPPSRQIHSSIAKNSTLYKRKVPKSSFHSPAFNPVQSPKPQAPSLAATHGLPPHPRDGSR